MCIRRRDGVGDGSNYFMMNRVWVGLGLVLWGSLDIYDTIER